jgi:hypothetical protein
MYKIDVDTRGMRDGGGDAYGEKDSAVWGEEGECGNSEVRWWWRVLRKKGEGERKALGS